MSKIKILDTFTANQIAAGEVVERPASVVKELCENSLDAGASVISVSIQNGGIVGISVVDNGSGMDRDDAKLAFLRHATSKICTVADFDSIKTMGFRGEALASIASVSKVTLKTRQIGSKDGTIVKIEDGDVIEHSAVGCNEGTSILVEYLFYNTPARYKFLKKDSTESSYITDIIERFILARPDVSFRLYQNNQQLLHSPGNNDLLSAIFSVYGKQVVAALIPISYKSEILEINGFIGKPLISRGTRQHQSVFVNNRYIKSKTASAAIEEAYKTLLMKGKFPFCVLNINISPSLVDVNVHPQKTEVKFWNDREVFISINHALKNALSSGISIPDISVDEKRQDFNNKNNEKIQYLDNNNNEMIQNNNNNQNGNNQTSDNKQSDYYQYPLTKPNNEPVIYKSALDKSKYNVLNDDNQNHYNEDTAKQYGDDNQSHFNKDVDKQCSEANQANFNETAMVSESQNSTIDYNNGNISVSVNTVNSDNNASTSINNNEIKNSYVNELDNAKYLGSLFNTYLLLEIDKNLIMIDQHAAHERILFEKILTKYNNHSTLAQLLLTPQLVELTVHEIAYVKEETEFLLSIGYDCEIFGTQTVLLRSVPSESSESDIINTFKAVIDTLTSNNNKSKQEVIEKTLYTIACKAAVKAKERMSDIEIEYIINELQKISNPTHCPHGRPVLLKMSQYEIEKHFKRIV